MSLISDGATAISADGLVIVGSDVDYDQAFRWTAESGKVLLGSLAPNLRSEALNVSADGSTIVGQIELGTSFRWTEARGFEALEPSATPGLNTINPAFSYALAATGSGEAIVGSGNGTVAYVWTESFGMESLSLVLENRFGLGDALVGWQLEEAWDISPDGRAIVGHGRNPAGNQEAWLVRLDRPIYVPEPSAFYLIVLLVASLACSPMWNRLGSSC